MQVLENSFITKSKIAIH